MKQFFRIFLGCISNCRRLAGTPAGAACRGRCLPDRQAGLHRPHEATQPASLKCTLFLLSFITCISSFSYAGPGNIAPLAKVTASTFADDTYAVQNVTDGWIGVDGRGEWACEGVSTDWGYIRLPWIQLEWEQPQLINKIVLYDRPSLKENIAGGKLMFSDSSILWVNQVPADGSGMAISFTVRKV